MLTESDHLYGLQASILKTLASPRRLEIVHFLGEAGPVNVLLQPWALDAFRLENANRPTTLASEAGADGQAAVRERAPGGRLDWLATFRQAKELGELSINACSASLDLLGLDVSKLDPIVDGAAGVATFFLAAGDGQIVFI